MGHARGLILDSAGDAAPRLEKTRVVAAGRALVLRRSRAAPSSAAGPPILLLHALAASWRWWRPVLAHLGRGREILVPDLPGFGGSPGLPPPIPDQAGSIAATLDLLDIPGAHVVGHSMGGAVAAELAARRPERVRSLVLVDTAGWPIRIFPRYLARLAQPWSWCRPSFLPILVSDVVGTGPVRIAVGARRLLTYDIRPALPAITAPTLVVWGERDRLLPPEMGRDLARRIPGAGFHIVPGAGHIVPTDRPAELARLLEEFWGGLSSRTPESRAASRGERRGDAP